MMRGICRWASETDPTGVSDALWTVCQKSALGQYVFLYIKRRLGFLSLYMCVRNAHNPQSVFSRPVKLTRCWSNSQARKSNFNLVDAFRTHINHVFVLLNTTNYRPVLIIAFGKKNLKKMKAAASQFIEKLKSPEIYHIFEKPALDIMIPIDKSCYTFELCPSAVTNQPDHFLQHGDEVFVEHRLFGFRFFHSGIYHKGGFVYHFIDLPDPRPSKTFMMVLRSLKNNQGAVVFDCWKDFIGALGTHGNIYRCQHFLNVRTGDQVIRVAREIQTERRYFTYYDVRFCNCQHFSSYCSRGVAYSYDMANKLRYLACSLLPPIMSSKKTRNSCPKFKLA